MVESLFDFDSSWQKVFGTFPWPLLSNMPHWLCSQMLVSLQAIATSLMSKSFIYSLCSLASLFGFQSSLTSSSPPSPCTEYYVEPNRLGSGISLSLLGSCMPIRTLNLETKIPKVFSPLFCPLGSCRWLYSPPAQRPSPIGFHQPNLDPHIVFFLGWLVLVRMVIAVGMNYHNLKKVFK